MPAKNLNKARREGAAYTIAEECERLFCGTLRAVFFGERNATSGSLVVGTQHVPDYEYDSGRRSTMERVQLSDRRFALTSPESSVHEYSNHPSVEKWLEIFDYVGGARFRGFVACNDDGNRAMFIFFDQSVVGCDLKPGLMALLELCDVQEIDCSQLVVCLERELGSTASKAVKRDLGWVGFEPLTLADWTDADDILSERWVFLGMET